MLGYSDCWANDADDYEEIPESFVEIPDGFDWTTSLTLPDGWEEEMKIKDVEVSNYKDCPLRDLCNTVHCGSPDTCLFCSMSDEELEMEVDDYIEKQEARIERHEKNA